MQSKFKKEAMWYKVEENKEIETSSTTNTRNNMLSPKATAFSKVLQDIDIIPKENEVYQTKKVTTSTNIL